MSVKVSKFGGTSLADAAQIRKVIDILRSTQTAVFGALRPWKAPR